MFQFRSTNLPHPFNFGPLLLPQVGACVGRVVLLDFWSSLVCLSLSPRQRCPTTHLAWSCLARARGSVGAWCAGAELWGCLVVGNEASVLMWVCSRYRLGAGYVAPSPGVADAILNFIESVVYVENWWVAPSLVISLRQRVVFILVSKGAGNQNFWFECCFPVLARSAAWDDRLLLGGRWTSR